MTYRKDNVQRLVTYDVKLGPRGSILTKIEGDTWRIQNVSITVALTLQNLLSQGYVHVNAAKIRHEYANLKVLPGVGNGKQEAKDKKA